MSRNYKNFIDSYLAYKKDEFVPDKFHLWTAISMVAGALERKCCLQWGDSADSPMFYPNLYILLVAKPGIGKSSAINPGVAMLKEVNKYTGSSHIKFLPSQVTEARLIELMRHPTTFQRGTEVVKQCAGYYYASEASACLKNIYGDFTGLITSFYDCDKEWEKATMGMENDTYKLVNVCFNLIAGSTFDYLGKLITDDNIMGGFASRLIYVIQNEVMVRKSPFQNRGIKQQTPIDRKLLLHDLVRINKLVGNFHAEESVKLKWEAWYSEYDAARQQLPSESMQALLARKSTNLLKLCMILSASEDDDLIIKEHHWDRAMDLINGVEADLPSMLREGKAKDTRSQSGLNQAIFRKLITGGGRVKLKTLEQVLQLEGFQTPEIRRTLETYKTENNVIKIHDSIDGIEVELIGNADDYL